MILRNSLINCLLFFACVALNHSCALTKGGSSNTLLTVDGTPVTREEFLYVYHKNNVNGAPQSREELNEYLDLFVNFRLKVREAEKLGLDKDSAFIAELDSYRNQLARPYLTETRLVDSLSRITYQRLKTEINASHILFLVPEEASPEDTLKAYERIMSLRDKLASGQEDFGNAAMMHSEDPSAKQNKGNLGYFTAMQMVYPFEEAAYGLPVDSISMPVRTNFGYHLIKVHDRRTSQGRIRVSHILVRTQEGISANDSLLSAKRAQEIYSKAINNEDWDLLCRQFSEDIGTKMKGGNLPWFKTGDISNIPSFEKAAFELEEIGEIHEPVKTAYGWHIIRLDDKQGLESFETLEPNIRSSLTADSRADLNQQELVKRLKKENKFKEHRDVVQEAMEFANETLNKGTWKSQEHWQVQQKELFSIDKTVYPVSWFYIYLEANQPLKYQAQPREMMRLAYQDYVRESLIDYEEAHLGEKYYEYKMLAKEYRDGIMLFQLMEDKVWNQAIRDTVGLQNYFEAHRDDYRWDTRVSANIFNVIDKKALDEVRQFLNEGYFTYSKYDFYGADEELNNAQLRILNDIAQNLSQHPERMLTMEYDVSADENIHIQRAVREVLSQRNIDSTRVILKALPPGAQTFVLYLVSSSLNDLEENMNKDNPLTIQIESGLYQHGANQAVDMVEWKKGVETVEIDNRQLLVQINEVLPEGRQQLDEIKGQVISDYQTYLESQWIGELRGKYHVDIHEKELEKIFRHYNL